MVNTKEAYRLIFWSNSLCINSVNQRIKLLLGFFARYRKRVWCPFKSQIQFGEPI